MEAQSEFIERQLRIAPKKGAKESVERVSTWFILINSNVSDSGQSQTNRIVSRINKAARETFNKDNFNLIFAGQIARDANKKKGLAAKPYQPYTPKIANAPPPKIQTLSQPEIGSVKNRIHVHLVLNVTHYGKLQMNYHRVHEFLRARIIDDEIINPFISIKHYKSQAGVLAYLGKGEEAQKEINDPKIFDEIDKSLLGKFSELNIDKELQGALSITL